MTIRHNKKAVTCPWEVYDRGWFVAAYQTRWEALQHLARKAS